MQPTYHLPLYLCVLLASACSDDADLPTTDERCTELYSTFEPAGDPSFANEVMPIFQASCNAGSCHGGDPSEAQAALWLGPGSKKVPTAEEIESVRLAILDVKSTVATELALVRADDPGSSFLMLKLDECHAQTAIACEVSDLTEEESPCGELMPLLSDKLDEKDLAVVRSWIANGAKAN